MALISPEQVAPHYSVPAGELACGRRAGTAPIAIAPHVFVRHGADRLDDWFRDPLNAPSPDVGRKENIQT
ncbi:hypothetical protein GCM10027404_21830 [Arthrobacter tumbae]|nr:hypothetical protein [Arthrobacter tumbae]